MVKTFYSNLFWRAVGYPWPATLASGPSQEIYSILDFDVVCVLAPGGCVVPNSKLGR